MSHPQTSSKKAIRTGPIFGVMLAGAFVAFLNQTLINVALPQMMNSLHITAAAASWLTTIYMLVNGIVIPITAYLMDRFTTRQLYISCMGLFTVGTLVCAMAGSLSIILVGRVIQAVGAGVLFPLIINVIFTLFPANRRGFAMGIFGVAMNFAPAIGPTLSGWIVQNYSWRVLFFVILPIALLDFAVALFLIKNVSQTSRKKLDMVGVILSTVGFGGILYACSIGGDSGFTSTLVLTLLAVGTISLILFIWRQFTVEYPILEFRIFRYKMFTLTTVINVVVTMALYSGMILMPIYMQNVRGFSPLLSGLMLLPGGILMGIMSPITGKLFDRFGAKWLSICGLAITILTTYALAKLQLDTTFTYATVVYTARMFGISILMMPIFTAGLNELALSLNKYGTAMVNTLRMVAGAIGMAFFVSIMTNESTQHIKSIIAQFHIMPTDRIHMHIAVNQASVLGIDDAFMVATGLTVVAFVLSFFVHRTEPKEDTITNRVQKRKQNESICV